MYIVYRGYIGIIGYILGLYRDYTKSGLESRFGFGGVMCQLDRDASARKASYNLRKCKSD